MSRTYVEVSVDIEDFDDDVIIEAAKAIMARRKTGLLDLEAIGTADPIDLAHRARMALIERNPREFDHLARELVGELTGTIQ